MKKPSWLNKRINLFSCHELKNFLRASGLKTVCEESLCPNISECFRKRVATFMILGNHCTRNCKFCAVAKGKFLKTSVIGNSAIYDSTSKVDFSEPEKIAKAVMGLGLNYIVITSPTRDDLFDGGAEMFLRTVKAIKNINSAKKVEILIPDFLGNLDSLIKISGSQADVVGHNLETVPSLYTRVRPLADYGRSLFVLKKMKELNKNIFTKSGIMLGLGEKENELIKVFNDLREIKCDFLTLGQYLAPSSQHYPVRDYITPDKFDYLEKVAYGLGFKKVKSSPYVRSSYLAEEFFETA